MKVNLRLLIAGLCFLLVTNVLNAQQVPVPDHVVVVMMENHGYSQIIGSADAPYLNSLATDSFGALFTNSHGMTHPSQPNYMYIFSGDNQNVILDFTPFGFLLPFTSNNLGAELLQNGKTFVGYSEDLPSVGFTGDSTAGYYRKHAPWVNWQDGTTNGIPAALNQPFTAFPSNFNNLPTLSFVIPNEDHDMHNGTIAQGDAWVQANLGSYAQWAKTHNSLLILTYDEDENLTGSNQIATIFIGQMVKHGQYNENVDHNRVLRTMEDMYSLPYAGGSSGSTPIVDCWVYKPVSAFGAAPVAICPGQTVAYVDSTINLPTTTQWLFAGGTPGVATGANPSVTYDSAGVYDVTLISANQMGADTLVKHNYITVHPVPVVSLNHDTVALCTGDTAIVVANGASFYNWLPQSNMFYSAGNTMKANPVSNTIYQVIGLMNGCISDTSQVLVTVDSILNSSLSITPGLDTTVCNNTTVTFTASAINGGNNPLYQWKLNGSTTNTHTPSFSTYAFGNNYTVSCAFTSSATCAVPHSIVSPTINVTVEQAPTPVISVIDSSLTSAGAATYQWYLNGQPINGATLQNYIAIESGSYTVEAFSAAGCSATSGPVNVVLATTGIFEIGSGSITVYPNPNSGYFTLSNLPLTKGNCDMRMFDLSGRTVFQSGDLLIDGLQSIKIRTCNLEPSVYFLVISQNDKSFSAKVFIR